MQSTLRRMAVSTIATLNEYGVHYWADYGTLLGIVRDDDIILSDFDVDICIADDRATHGLINGPVRRRLESLGCSLERVNPRMYRVYLFRKWHGFRLHADLYLTERRGDTIVGPNGPNSDIASSLVGTPRVFKWRRCGLDVKVPERVHETLVWRYGRDYTTPRPFFKGRDS